MATAAGIAASGRAAPAAKRVRRVVVGWVAFSGGIPHERMLERVNRLRWRSFNENQLGRNELLERRLEFRLTRWSD
jgi:hypothetical protein